MMWRFVNRLISVVVLLGALAGPVSPSIAAKGFVQAPGSPFSPGVSHLFSVRLADLNADGNLDAIVPDGYGLGVSVLLGDGRGRLDAAPGSPYEVHGGAGPVAIGDFNGDGKLDVAVGNQFLSSVSVLLGDGQGGLAPASAQFFPINGPASYLEGGDFNRDGRLDVVALGLNGASALLGDGQGSFSLAPGSPFSTAGDDAGSGQPYLLTVADFNRDEQVDLAVVNRSPVGLAVLLGDGSGAFSAAAGSPYSTGGVVIAVATADFNRDRIPDLAATNNNSAPENPFGSVAVLLGRGIGSFSLAAGSPFFTQEEAVLSLAVADFNGDRRADAAVASEAADDIPVFLGNGRGAMRPLRGGAVPAGGQEPDWVAAGDLNGDRKSDLVVTNYVSNDVSVLLSARGH
jgi:FG-GAP-like repeat